MGTGPTKDGFGPLDSELSFLYQIDQQLEDHV